jgi:hypothetical protein
MGKLNCWEAKKCGREIGGGKTRELGVCPTAMESRLAGAHEGTFGGRACWVVAGTLCGGKEQGTFAQKYHNCEKCDFYQHVKREEGPKFKLSIVLLSMLKTSLSPLEKLQRQTSDQMAMQD